MGYTVEQKLPIQNALVKEPTGFTDPASVMVTYDPATLKITLTGTVVAYWQGNVIPSLVTGWTSAAHTDSANTYYLYYNGTNFVWSSLLWSFDMLQIAVVQYAGSNVGWGTRECHGMMPYQVHDELHDVIGTYVDSGGGATSASYTLNSQTAANRRPLFNQVVLADEDLLTTNSALLSASYTLCKLGTGLAYTLTTGQSDVVPLNGNVPYYNQISGGNGIQTAMTNNQYQKLFVVGIPVTTSAYAQLRRFVIFQGQTVSTTLATIQAITFKSISKGTFATFVAEFVPLVEIIIQYQSSGANWALIEVNTVNESRGSSSTSGVVGLTSISTSSYLTGNGTGGSPISITGVGTAYAVPFEKSDSTQLLEDASFLYDTTNKRLGVGSTSLPTDGTFEATIVNIAATAKTGLKLINPTASTAGVPTQNSPSILMKGSAWNSTSVASVDNYWRMLSVPVNGSATSSYIYYQVSSDGTNWTTIASLAQVGGVAQWSCAYTIASSALQSPIIYPNTDADMYVSTSAATAGKNIYFGSNKGNTIWGQMVDSKFVWLGRIEGKQGVDIACANNLTLGLDGNTFNITTGVNTLNLINSVNWQAGSVVRLKFTVPTIINNNVAASTTYYPIVLASGANYTTTANQVLEFELRADNVWYEIGQSSLITATSSKWNNILANASSTPASTSTITMVSDLTATVLTGYALKYKIGAESTYRYGIVDAITNNLLTLKGAALTTNAGDLKELYWADARQVLVYNAALTESSFDAASNTDVLTGKNNNNPIKPDTDVYVAYYEVWCNTADTGTKSTITLMNAANAVSTALTLTASGTYYDSGIGISVTYYKFTRGTNFRIDTASAGNKNTIGAIVNIYAVMP